MTSTLTAAASHSALPPEAGGDVLDGNLLQRLEEGGSGTPDDQKAIVRSTIVACERYICEWVRAVFSGSRGRAFCIQLGFHDADEMRQFLCQQVADSHAKAALEAGQYDGKLVEANVNFEEIRSSIERIIRLRAQSHPRGKRRRGKVLA